jgi:hypothetical protein
MEKIGTMPQIAEQLMRLKDVRRRIEVGASANRVR